MDSTINSLIVCPDCAIGEAPVYYNSQVVTASAYSYTITSLTPGVTYVVRLSAMNDRGYGDTVIAAPATLEVPLQVSFPFC